ncbi:MAG: hypothetical protein HY590_06155 [Candidatus Omnitrophica bacterium]|nr:hypothetical protein [Candidatus Omnitrophota bacterium]
MLRMTNSPETLLWSGKTGARGLLVRYSPLVFLGAGMIRLTYWGAFFCWGLFSILFFSSSATAFLTSETLTLKKRGRRSQEVDLGAIGKLEVRQYPWHRFCHTGDLLIELSDSKKPLLLREFQFPYEGWKRIKIAAFQKRQGKSY